MDKKRARSRTGPSRRTAGRSAELILLGGRLVTMDVARPTAQALAIRAGRIIAVGSDREIRRCRSASTRVLELNGALAVPGFIEGHGHFLMLGNVRRQLDLSAARSWEQVVTAVGRAACTTPSGDWITGFGWHQERWERPPKPNLEGFPLHDSLSRVTPQHPVWLTHACGHAAFANARAMELCGIGPDTPTPPGGKIVRDAQGRPTGLFQESAGELISRVLQEDRRRKEGRNEEPRWAEEARVAARECLARGITSFQDAGASLRQIRFFRKLADAGELPIRLWVMLRGSTPRLAWHLPRLKALRNRGHMFTVRAIKCSVDGALGSATAWMLEPYADIPGYTGLPGGGLGRLPRLARLALANDFQLCVHAIGDRANRETLDQFEKAFRRYKPKRGPRWRIEHAQHLDPADVPRFAELGVIASMQAVHLLTDAPAALKRFGKARAREGTHVWRSLLDAGTVVTNGTDTPVEDPSPITCFHTSVTRRLPDGSRFVPEQCMTRAEALRSYTLANACAAFEEELKGSLTPGKLADITVLSRDIMTIPADEIPGTEVLCTLVGGKVMYEKGA